MSQNYSKSIIFEEVRRNHCFVIGCMPSTNMHKQWVHNRCQQNEAKSYRALSPAVPGRLTTLDLLTHLRAICLSTTDTFSGYAVAVQVWAAGSGHTIGLLKLSCVICLAFWTTCSLILMHQMLLNRLLVKVLLNLSSFLPSRYWCCREMQQLSQTLTQKTFWLHFPHFCLAQKSSKAV